MFEIIFITYPLNEILFFSIIGYQTKCEYKYLQIKRGKHTISIFITLSNCKMFYGKIPDMAKTIDTAKN